MAINTGNGQQYGVNIRAIPKENPKPGEKKQLSVTEWITQQRHDRLAEVQRKQAEKALEREQFEFSDEQVTYCCVSAASLGQQWSRPHGAVITESQMIEWGRSGIVPGAGRDRNGKWYFRSSTAAHWHRTQGGFAIINKLLAQNQQQKRDTHWEAEGAKARETQKEAEYKVAARQGGDQIAAWRKRWEEIEAADAT